MRRSLVLLLSLTLLAGTLLGAGRALPIGAQGATPTAAPGAVGVAFQVLGRGLPKGSPGQALSLLRVTLQPGGTVATHTHPGQTVLYVDSGTFGYTLYQGEVQLTRAAVAGTPGPTEQLTPGTEAILHPGDWLFEQGVVHSARNAGDTPAVVLIAALTAADKPFTQYVTGMPGMEATPTP